MEGRTSTVEDTSVVRSIVTMQRVVIRMSGKLSTLYAMQNLSVRCEIESLAGDLVDALTHHRRQVEAKLEELQQSARNLPKLEDYEGLELLECVKQWHRLLPPFHEPLGNETSLFKRFARTFDNHVYTGFFHGQHSPHHAPLSPDVASLSPHFDEIYLSARRLIERARYLDDRTLELRFKLSIAMIRLRAAPTHVKIQLYKLHQGLEKLKEETDRAAERLERQQTEQMHPDGGPMNTGACQNEEISTDEPTAGVFRARMLALIDQETSTRVAIDDWGSPAQQTEQLTDPFAPTQESNADAMGLKDGEARCAEKQGGPPAAMDQLVLDNGAARVDVRDFAQTPSARRVASLSEWEAAGSRRQGVSGKENL